VLGRLRPLDGTLPTVADGLPWLRLNEPVVGSIGVREPLPELPLPEVPTPGR
jgi:hypothetical protein